MKRFLMMLSVTIAANLPATTIHWFCAPKGQHVMDNQAPMDAGFRFELGVFRNGFVPTTDNQAVWADHWVAAQRVVYHAGNQWFTAVHEVEDNADAFAVGTNAYIWGFHGGPEDGEWILFRKSSWRWPRANPGFPIAREWYAAEADEVLIGDVGGVASYHLRSRRVQNLTPPTTTWQQWLTETDAEPGPERILEYATGSEHPRLTMTRDEKGQVLLHVPKRADRPANLWLEVSEDLVSWKPLSGQAALLQQTPTGLIFARDFLGGEDTPEENLLFFRFKVALP